MPRELCALRFDPVQHRYWTGSRELVAVTAVLRTAGVVDATWWTLHARERGGAVHRAAEAVDRGEASGPDDPTVAPYLDAYRAFLHDTRPVWHGIEQPAADCTLGYAGTPDRWGTLQGDPVVIDLKTGTVPSWAPLQLAAYGRLALGAEGIVRRRRIIVQLLPTARYTLREYPLDHVHHLQYRSRGGRWTTTNCLVLCRTCHQDVHARILVIEGTNADLPAGLTFEWRRWW